MKMRKQNKILITRDALRTIISDSKKHSVETGGILVGVFGEQWAIVNAGKSGANSFHHAVQYTSDAQRDTLCLQNANEKFGDNILPLGWWHKHPGNFDKPSGGDCIQVRKLAAEYNDGKPVLMGIVNRYQSKGRIKTTLKFYSLNQQGQLMEHPWRLVSSSNPELQAAIKSPHKPNVRNTEFWQNEDFQFYLNPIGRQRIKKEIRQLKDAGWHVTTSRKKTSGVMVMDITDGLREITLKLPPEYPLNPPIVFTGEYEIDSLDSLVRWNSLRNLLTIATEIKEL